MRRHRSLNDATYNTGEELFLGTCDRRGVRGVGVLVNTRMAINIGYFEQRTTRNGRLRLKRCGSRPAATIFAAYVPTSSYIENEVEILYIDLEKFYSEDHIYYKVIVGLQCHDGPRRTTEELDIRNLTPIIRTGANMKKGFPSLSRRQRPSMETRSFKSPSQPCESPGGEYHNKIDIIVNRKYSLTEVSVVS